MLDASSKMSAQALQKKLEEAHEILRNTICELPSYDAIIPVLLSDGIESLPSKCFLTPGISEVNNITHNIM